MTLFDHLTVVSAEACAAALMDTVPLVMRTIRAEMRSHRPADLSVQQFRALLFVYRRPGCSLSQVAEHVGLTLPSTSKLIDRLVTRTLIDRRPLAHNRRRMALSLTPLGQATLEEAQRATRVRLSEQLSALSPDELAAVMRGLSLLDPIFTQEQELEPKE